MPFTEEQFFRVFREYNQGVFPMQVVLNLLAGCAVVFACNRPAPSNRIVTGLLAFLWIWPGAVYHLFFFTSVNPAAYFFGGMFIVQGCLLVYRGIFQQRLEFRFDRDPHGILGAVLVIYSLFIYPLTCLSFGHTFPAEKV